MADAKAFFGHVPFPLIHIDTTYKIPEMVEYRDRLTREWKLMMMLGSMRQPLKQADLSRRQGGPDRLLSPLEDGGPEEHRERGRPPLHLQS